ncbi:unnamed protein product [Onchocerca ochengi]|uniref:Protein kinase domain-containing protein n=1 Tax=Onchocerca ochengi TaxID=42157 RepID=A0A182EXV4_ONCOC|nr:unnamed protein product [Onchocerca ochengi]
MSMKELIDEQKNAVVAPHPIHIEMEIACQDDIYVTLVLQYIPGLRSVGAMAKLNRVPTSIYGSALFDVSLLAELFDGDDGSKCVNNAGQAKLDQLEYAFFNVLYTYSIDIMTNRMFTVVTTCMYEYPEIFRVIFNF